MSDPVFRRALEGPHALMLPKKSRLNRPRRRVLTPQKLRRPGSFRWRNQRTRFSGFFLENMSVDISTGRIDKKGELGGGLVSSSLLPGEICVCVLLLLCDGVPGNVNIY